MTTDSHNKREGNGKTGSVMVVGAGIGGMQAALDLANSGFHVTLVEETSAIGGRMAQLDKTFPTNDCSMCTISPKLIEVDKHLNIDVLTNARVVGLQGEVGNFQVEVRKQPRFIDLDKCNACGDCIDACPVSVPDEFDQGLGTRSAVHKRYPQAIPSAMAISKEERPPCVLTCPAHVNCQGYVALVGDGRFAEAYSLIRERNPFPGVCGRVCHHPCEQQCNRRDLDEPVAVNNLKRFAVDWVWQRRAEGEDPAPPPEGEIDPNKERVAVVGGGPAGLTAARDLALRGYPVTLFEAHDELGGTMLSGIPRYRLPDEMLRRDIDDILAAGFRVETGKRLGRDFSLQSLSREGFKAVFLGIGCTKPAPLTNGTQGSELMGADRDNVLSGLDFLRDVKLDRGTKLGGRVVVIGGGNVAVDVAMTARRQGADSVDIVCLEGRDEMPAHEWEVLDALEEGIELNPSWGVRELFGEDGRVQGVDLQRCTQVFDEQGQFSPLFDGESSKLQADWVITAIGQRSDLAFLADDDPLWDPSRRFIEADDRTLQTRVDWIFAGGDMVSGPASVVEAVAQGHEAAESIDRYLSGRDLVAGRDQPAQTPAPAPANWLPVQERVKPERVPAAERDGYEEIENTLSEDMAVAEARRCLACGVCSECMECVEVCEAGAIIHDMVPEKLTVETGAILLAPGFEPYDPVERGEYGYGVYENVITSLEFERILSASGPYEGHVQRPSDRAQPKRVAWIQCVGSRDRRIGNEYCSGVCCMYAIKEAVMAVDHVPGVEATIYYNDIRAYGKDFEAYYEAAKTNHGVAFRRGIISSVKERQQTKNLVLTYVTEAGEVTEEEVDLLVLSVGLKPSSGTAQLSETLDIERNRFGFCQTGEFQRHSTTRDGVYVAGTFATPMDIPETVMSASSAAAAVSGRLAEVRGTQTRDKTYPSEREVSNEEPRVGVFVCHCGTNIARVVKASEVVEYADSLPAVVHAEENLYTCSTDTQKRIIDAIHEHRLNRVVVASCTPRTHERLFQDTLREAGLNRRLFEMANIRDQCSWVHYSQPDQATFKAKDLVRMAVARVETLEPFEDLRLEVDQRGIVLGAGVAGMTAALSLADQGFEVTLVEREQQPGGNARRIRHTLGGGDPQALVAELIERIDENPRITLHTGASVEDFSGHVGRFRATLNVEGRALDVEGGAVIVATGGSPYEPTEYGYRESESVITQLELESKLQEPGFAEQLNEIVMIQCVGSREEGRPYCSRVCCQEAVKNALACKRANPDARVYVLFRDMRTYGFDEIHYEEARRAGVVFIRFEPENKPHVSSEDGLRVTVLDDVLQRPVVLTPDYVVLSAGIRPDPDAEAVSQALKVPLNSDGFFLEAHMKLRPLDFPTEGVYLAGLAHAPKTMAESIAQARGAAARAATVLSQTYLEQSGIVAKVDTDVCAGCLTCSRLCPYDVPEMNENGVAFIEPASCHGCGVCAAACPRKAIVTQHYSDDQLVCKVDALFGDQQYEAACPAVVEPGGD